MSSSPTPPPLPDHLASGGTVDPEKLLDAIEVQEMIAERKDRASRRQRLRGARGLNIAIPFGGIILATLDAWLDRWRDRRRSRSEVEIAAAAAAEEFASLTPRERRRLALEGKVVPPPFAEVDVARLSKNSAPGSVTPNEAPGSSDAP